MIRNHKKTVIAISLISIIALTFGFFHQFEVDYSDYKKIKPVGGEGFYPDGYSVFHTEKEFLQSATYLYDGKDITHVMNKESRILYPIQIGIIASVLRPDEPNLPIQIDNQLRNYR